METEKNRKMQRELEAIEQPAKSETVGTEASGNLRRCIPGDGEELASAYQRLLKEKQEVYEQLLRKQADFENFRTRIQRQQKDLLHQAAADLVGSLLPTLDGFEQALKIRYANIPDQFYKGVELLYKQLVDELSRDGLEPVETVGKIFDPHMHQADETVDLPGYRDIEIVEEIQKGYKLKQRLLRPAIVKVAMRPHDVRASGPEGSKKPQQ